MEEGNESENRILEDGGPRGTNERLEGMWEGDRAFTEGVGMIAPEVLPGDSDQEGGQGCQWGTRSAEAGIGGDRGHRTHRGKSRSEGAAGALALTADSKAPRGADGKEGGHQWGTTRNVGSATGVGKAAGAGGKVGNAFLGHREAGAQGARGNRAVGGTGPERLRQV